MNKTGMDITAEKHAKYRAKHPHQEPKNENPRNKSLWLNYSDEDETPEPQAAPKEVTDFSFFPGEKDYYPNLWTAYQKGEVKIRNPFKVMYVFIMSILDNPYYGSNHNGSPW